MERTFLLNSASDPNLCVLQKIRGVHGDAHGRRLGACASGAPALNDSQKLLLVAFSIALSTICIELLQRLDQIHQRGLLLLIRLPC